MFRRDYILKEIQKLNILLAKIIGLKAEGRSKEALEVINEKFEDSSGLSLAAMSSMDEPEIIPYLESKENIELIHIKVLSELMFQAAGLHKEEQDTSNAILLYKKSLILLNYITQKEKTFDFERENQINQIQHELDMLTG